MLKAKIELERFSKNYATSSREVVEYVESEWHMSDVENCKDFNEYTGNAKVYALKEHADEIANFDYNMKTWLEHVENCLKTGLVLATAYKMGLTENMDNLDIEIAQDYLQYV